MGIIPKGCEPANVKVRMNTLFAKLDDAYPNKVIIGLCTEHKKWDENARELSRLLGYESKNDFLIAYGYEIEAKATGRPQITDADAVIAELKKRYPNGSGYYSLEKILSENSDLRGKIKTLSNTAQKTFGMPLKDYLLAEGILMKRPTKEDALLEYEVLLDKFFLDLGTKLQGLDYIPNSIDQIKNLFPELDIRQAKQCVRHLYGTQKAMEEILEERGLLEVPANEDAEMHKYIEILQERYRGISALPSSLTDLADQNPDVPARKLSKYIREVWGEKKAENYYIKKKIMQGSETDLQEYVYCEIEVQVDGGVKSFHYISTLDDLQVGDMIVAEFGWSRIILGRVLSVRNCLGIDAPWPPNKTKTIFRKARENEINRKEVDWTLEDKWTYQWREDDAQENRLAAEGTAPTPTDLAYLYAKRALIELIEHSERISTAPDRLHSADLCRLLLWSDDLAGGSYIERDHLCMLITRIHNTAQPLHAKAIEQLKVDDPLLHRIGAGLEITTPTGELVGCLSSQVAKAVLPMIVNGFASIKEIAVTYVRPQSAMPAGKAHSALYAAILLELCDPTNETAVESCIALRGHDWKANATQVQFMKTTVPLSLAKRIMMLWYNCPSKESLDNYCCEKLAEEPEIYEKIKPYIQDVPHGDDGLYKQFEKFAVDESTHYWLKKREVDYATWQENYWYSHWGDTMILLKKDASYKDAYNPYNGSCFVVLSEG